MNDLISRQAAIDLFPNDALEWDTNGGYIAPHFARRMIEDLPSAQPKPQWIPVSKKPPNKNDYVIVTTKCGVVIEAQFEVWNSGKKEWWIDNDNSLEFDDVVAWMPMPKPYERKEE